MSGNSPENKEGLVQRALDSGLVVLMAFYLQQLALLIGLGLLVLGVALWQHWFVFAGLLSLRSAFFLQKLYRQRLSQSCSASSPPL